MRIKKSQILILFIFVSLLTSTVTACTQDSDESIDKSSSYEDTGFAMGTVVNQTIYSEDKNIASEIIELLTKTEETWISWRSKNSEIAKINDNALSEKSSVVSNETAVYLSEALTISVESDGAFDPTIGKLSRLWDFDSEKNIVPSQSEVDQLLKDIDYKNIKIKGNTVSVNEGASIDLGAIGKGIGCDEIEKYLDLKEDVNGALINVGGSSILTYGSKISNEPWKVAVLNPRDESGFLGAITLDGTNHISTSGDYEKYFEEGDIRYHHILDPATGYPAESGLISVTIVGKQGALCDGISTACFVMGLERGMALLEKNDLDGIFVDKDKNVYVSEGLKNKFELMAEGFNYK